MIIGPEVVAEDESTAPVPHDRADLSGGGSGDGRHDVVAPRHVAEVASHFRLASTRLVRRLRQEAATGLPLSSLSALAVINARGPLSLGAIAEIEGVTPPTVTRITQRLEKDGLVERSTDRDDKRFRYVRVTREGRALLVRSRDRRNAWLAERLATLSPDDLEAVDRVARLAERFVSEPDGADR